MCPIVLTYTRSAHEPMNKRSNVNIFVIMPILGYIYPKLFQIYPKVEHIYALANSSR